MNKKDNKNFPKKEEEFQQRIIDVARVTRVMAGGKRMKFRVCLAIGDKKGRVGYSVAKGPDVTAAISKAFSQAKKNVIKVPMINETIVHPMEIKFKSAKLIFKPAKKGSGIKAGGAIRVLCELAGIPNISAKILGSNNKINNVKAAFAAFKSFNKHPKANNKSESDSDNNKEEKGAVKNTENKKEEKSSIKDKVKKIIKK